MYAYLWHKLPLPTWARLVVFLVGALLVLAVCFTVVFPLVLEVLQGPANTVEPGTGG